MATSKAIRRAYDLRLAPLDLNLSEGCLLAFVVQPAPITQRQVADRIGMGRAVAGPIVDALVRRGLLARSPDPDDRRVWLLSATADGEVLRERIKEVDAALRGALRVGLSKEQRRGWRTSWSNSRAT